MTFSISGPSAPANVVTRARRIGFLLDALFVAGFHAVGLLMYLRPNGTEGEPWDIATPWAIGVMILAAIPMAALIAALRRWEFDDRR